jgi:hypothetical protein
MVGVRAGDPELTAVMDAAGNLLKESPAYHTAQYHRIRLMIESKRPDEARAALDGILPGFRTTLQNSSLNLFLSQRLALARNFDEFLAFAPRIPQVAVGTLDPALEEYTRPETPLFDADSAGILNRGLPLRFFSKAAKSKLPLHLRKQLIRVAWVRAVLTGKVSAAMKLTNDLKQIYPELEKDVETWIEAGDAGAKQFALVMILLHFPGMSPYLQSGVPRRGTIAGINNSRENWWCGLDMAGSLDAPTGLRYNNSRNPQQREKPSVPEEFPAFLSNSEKSEFWAEWKKLADVPTAPDYFGKTVLSWAGKNPSDERVPEALHLVVKSTRFGCTDSDSGRYSRAAFRMLHSRYADTNWAKSTPYWYR